MAEETDNTLSNRENPSSGGRWIAIAKCSAFPVVLCAILLASCILQSRYQRLWFDEILTYHLVTDQSLVHMLSASADRIIVAPPLYSLVSWTWVRLFGDAEVILRLTSCLGFCAGGVVLWRLLGRKFGVWPATIGTFIALLGSPEVIDHNCEVRSYGLLFFETALATWLFVSLCERRQCSLKLLIANALIHAALATTHYHGFIYGVGFMLAFSAVFARDLRAAAVRCGSVCAGWLFFLPCVPGLLCQSALRKPHGWIRPPKLRDLFDVYNICGDNIVPIVLPFVVIALLIGVVRNGTRVRGGGSEGEDRAAGTTPLLVLSLCQMLMPVGAWCVSQVNMPLFMMRYFLGPLIVSWAVALAYFAERLQSGLSRKEDVKSPFSRTVLAGVCRIAFGILLLYCAGFANRDWVRSALGNVTEKRRTENETLAMLDQTPRDVPIACLGLFDMVLYEHYAERRQFVLLRDRDWSYSESADVPRSAPLCYETAGALNRQYNFPLADFASFLKEHDRFIVFTSDQMRPLYAKWFDPQKYTCTPLGHTAPYATILVQRKS